MCRASLCFLLAASTLPADVTVRYQTTGIAGSPMPMGGVASPEAIRVKGGMGQITSGGFTMISDSRAQRLTFLDAWHAKYATIPAAEYAAKMGLISGGGTAAAMEAVLGNANCKVESKSTGREETIQGVRTVEREVQVLVGEPAGMKVDMRIWTPKPGEARRLPALQELSVLTLFPHDIPGLSGCLGSLPAEMTKDRSVVLRTEFTLSMIDGDPDASPIRYRQEAIEISSAPVDAAIFEIPADYIAAPLEEVMLGATRGRLPEAGFLGAARPELPAPGVIQAYVSGLRPIYRVEPELGDSAKDGGAVRLLATVDPAGGVAKVEALTGTEESRRAAETVVRKWRFRPVVRNGQAVFAYTDVLLFAGGREDGSAAEMSQELAAVRRLSALAQSWPRTPAQVLADLEHDSEGDADRHFAALEDLAGAAMAADRDEKATAAAQELLATAAKRKDEPNSGDAIHAGHSILGLLALRRGNVASARNELLAAGKTPGSRQLNSSGPKVTLAKALLERGERQVVLEYFDECRRFWAAGAQTLDRWSEAVRRGEMPAFGENLPQQN